MTLPRRTLLTRAAAALAALSAPVVALGVGKRRGLPPLPVVADYGEPPFSETCGAPPPANLILLGDEPSLWRCAACGNWSGYEPKAGYRRYTDDLESSLREARGLLAEARDALAGHWAARIRSDPSVPLHPWIAEEHAKTSHLLMRIDSHLGRGAGREG